MSCFLRELSPDEVRALRDLERAENDYRRAHIQLETARWNYERIREDRESARKRGHLRLLRSPVPEQSGA